MDPGDFVQRYWPDVVAGAPDLSAKAQVMVLAHAAQESGWGSSAATRLAHNLFNLTAQPNEDSVPGGDLEYSGDHAKKIVQQWRVFSTFEECVAEYLKFIDHMRYRPALEQLKAESSTFIATLKAGGFFTLPAEQYYRTYFSVLTRVTKEALRFGLIQSPRKPVAADPAQQNPAQQDDPSGNA